jgi:hypothetical protein
MKAPTDNKIHDACCKYDPQDGGAMFVKRRDISLWWGFYNLHDTIGMGDRVMNNLRSPSVAELNVRKINSISFLYFTHEDTITNDYSVHCVV